MVRTEVCGTLKDFVLHILENYFSFNVKLHHNLKLKSSLPQTAVGYSLHWDRKFFQLNTKIHWLGYFPNCCRPCSFPGLCKNCILVFTNLVNLVCHNFNTIVVSDTQTDVSPKELFRRVGLPNPVPELDYSCQILSFIIYKSRNTGNLLDKADVVI